MLVPAGLPYVLDIAHYSSVADVQHTGEAVLNLPVVAVVTMPIELESQRKLEIEHMNIFHRRIPMVQWNWDRRGVQRCPVRFGYRWFPFPLCPVKRQHCGRARAPRDFN